MSNIWEAPYAVVDVETTGSDPKENRITEIACVKVIDGEIADEYSSLINPHQFIPPFISRMTGITNEMAYNAPEPLGVLKEINSIISIPNTIFTAHNVNFDWNFVRYSLYRHKMNAPIVDMLCTLKLARKLVGRGYKKNVGDLARYFGIGMSNRHRALGDARATAMILLELLDIVSHEHSIDTIEELLVFQNKRIQNHMLSKKSYSRVESKLSSLPSGPGVYYFLNKNRNIIYVGKAKCLKDRIRSYFNDSSVASRKIAELVNNIYDITWETTSNELSALILESKEIKRIKPMYNSAGKRNRKFPFIKISNSDKYPTLEISYDLNDSDAEFFGPIKGPAFVEEILKEIDKNYKVRVCGGGFSHSQGGNPCLYYFIEKCKAPCTGEVSADEYKFELDKVRFYLSGFSGGILKRLEEKMRQYSDNFEFENAALIKTSIDELKRLFDNKSELPSSVNNSNILLIMPEDERSKTVSLYLIKYGKLMDFVTVGRKADLSNVNKIVSSLFFNGQPGVKAFSADDITEMRIVSSWIHRNEDSATFLYPDGEKEESFIAGLERQIRNFTF